jgi:transcriptional regulator of met regulon
MFWGGFLPWMLHKVGLDVEKTDKRQLFNNHQFPKDVHILCTKFRSNFTCSPLPSDSEPIEPTPTLLS